MRLITDSILLSDTFKRLCSQYNHYKWAVAWAGDTHGFNLARLLDKNRSKIDQIVVGLHFYQTSPNFIEDYMNEPGLRFYMQSDGTFHAKIYLFYNDKQDWEALVGSSNFTNSGFNSNTEANILFDSHDDGVNFYDISSYVDSLWKQGTDFNENLLSAYRTSFGLQNKKLKSLSKLKGKRHDDIASSLELMTWEEYYHLITSVNKEGVEARLKLLDTAHKLFKSVNSFNDLPQETQRKMAGLVKYNDGDEFDWQWFGSTSPNGRFHNFVKEGLLGKAIDKIPLTGPVSRRQFVEYCLVFAPHYATYLALATRLLAIKRPDIFVCINKGNETKLGELMNRKKFTINDYWDEVVQKLHASEWYKANLTDAGTFESKIRRCRMAMLDCISYKKM